MDTPLRKLFNNLPSYKEFISSHNKMSLIKKKIHYFKRLKIKLMQRTITTVTNIFNEKIKLGPLECIYDYNRSGYSVVHSDTLKEYHPYYQCYKSHSPYTSFFLRNGQTANKITIDLLKALFDIKTFTIERSLYFESRFYIPKVTTGTKKEKIRALFYDFTSLNIKQLHESLRRYSATLKAVVIDTTYYDLYSPELEEIFKIISNTNLPVLLTRSHLKLDFFGSEYSLLGSLTICNGKQLPPGKLYGRLYKTNTIMSLIKFFISLQGAYAEPIQIFPYFNDSDYLKKGYERNKRRVNNCKKMIRECKKYIKRCTDIKLLLSFPHNQFFFVFFSKNLPTKEIRNKLYKLRTGAHEPIVVTSSFGYDVVSISEYVTQKSKLMGYRISPGDIGVRKSQEVMRKIIAAIITTSKNNSPMNTP